MMTILVFLGLVAQGPAAPPRDTLGNDRPQFPIGLARDLGVLREANQAATRDPRAVEGFLVDAAKRGALVPIPSGTRAKSLASDRLRGPMFKEVVEVEVSDGPHKGLRGWVCGGALTTSEEYRARCAAGDRPGEGGKYAPLYSDPVPGDRAYLAPQPTMIGMVRHFIRFAADGPNVAAVFQEWQESKDETREAVLKRLEGKKAVLLTALNTEVKVRKVFPDRLVEGIYPVEVEILGGQHRGKVGWVPVSVVSAAPGKAEPGKAEKSAEERRAEAEQKSAERKAKQSAKQAANQARAQAEAKAMAQAEAKAERDRAAYLAEEQVRSQIQLQMLRGQAAIAEAQAATEQARAYQMMAQSYRDRIYRDALINGSGPYYRSITITTTPPPNVNIQVNKPE